MTDDEWADHIDEVESHAKKALRAMTQGSDRRLFIEDLDRDLRDFVRQGCP